MYLDDRRTALYRFYDADGTLLYVGITQNLEERWAAHERDKPWWPDVSDRPVEWFDTRPLALDAERTAVQTESPIHNVTGKPWTETRRQLDEGERTVSQLRANLTEYCQRAMYAGEATVVVDATRKRRPVAVLVSPEWYERARAALSDS